MVCRCQAARPPRCGQRLPIQFAVVGQRQAGQQHEIAGNHVSRQAGLTGRSQLGQPWLGLGAAGRRQDVDRWFRNGVRCTTGIDRTQRRVPQDFVLLDHHVEALPPQQTDHLFQPPVFVVDLHHHLPDPVPVLGFNPLEDQPFTFLDIDLQQVDLFDARLGKDGRQGTQLTLELFRP
jgi:hypothetical protein